MAIVINPFFKIKRSLNRHNSLRFIDSKFQTKVVVNFKLKKSSVKTVQIAYGIETTVRVICSVMRKFLIIMRMFTLTTRNENTIIRLKLKNLRTFYIVIRKF